MWFYPSFRTLVTSLALIAPGIASAQQYQDWTWCYEPDSTRDQTIAGCTALILSGRESQDHLAVEFYNRANAHHAMGNYDYAIADYDQATRLNPKDAPTYNNRGNAYSKKGDYEHAIADYDQAIGLNPEAPSPYNNRGNAYYRKGDYGRAVADLVRPSGLTRKTHPLTTTAAWRITPRAISTVPSLTMMRLSGSIQTSFTRTRT